MHSGAGVGAGAGALGASSASGYGSTQRVCAELEEGYHNKQPTVSHGAAKSPFKGKTKKSTMDLKSVYELSDSALREHQVLHILAQSHLHNLAYNRTLYVIVTMISRQLTLITLSPTSSRSMSKSPAC